MYMNIVYVCNIIYTITAWLSNQRIKPKKKTPTVIVLFFLIWLSDEMVQTYQIE